MAHKLTKDETRFETSTCLYRYGWGLPSLVGFVIYLSQGFYDVLWISIITISMLFAFGFWHVE
jgi:hypothetical protein